MHNCTCFCWNCVIYPPKKNEERNMIFPRHLSNICCAHWCRCCNQVFHIMKWRCTWCTRKLTAATTTTKKRIQFFGVFKWLLCRFVLHIYLCMCAMWAMQVSGVCFLLFKWPCFNVRKMQLLNYQKCSFCTAKHHCHSTVYYNYIHFFFGLVSLAEQGATLEALSPNIPEAHIHTICVPSHISYKS